MESYGGSKMGVALSKTKWIVWLGAAMIAVFATSGGNYARAQAGGDTVLAATDAGKVLPASVWFKGQSATTQLRNSGGVKFADGFFVLSTLVDTSGYSSDVQAKYQRREFMGWGLWRTTSSSCSMWARMTCLR
jgi:hypothetical protein